VGEGAKMLEDRIAAAEAAMGAQKSQASSSSDASGLGGNPGGGSSVSKGASGGQGNPLSWYGKRSRPRSTASGGGGSGKAAPAEPPQERPMSADEARGFGPDGNGGEDGQPYTPTSDDRVT
jgi:hypothetical protein